MEEKKYYLTKKKCLKNLNIGRFKKFKTEELLIFHTYDFH